MSCRVIAAIGMSFVFGILLLVSGADASAQVNRMSKEELKAMLGKPDVIVLDVRQPADLAKSNQKIKGAVREDPRQDVKSWADKYSKDRKIVLYCA